MGAVSAYQAGGAHRHTPEIEQALDEAAAQAAGPRPDGHGTAGHGEAGRDYSVSFTPLLAPMPRGILATCTARLRPGAGAGVPWSGAQLPGVLAEAYAGEPFVTVLPDGRWPTTAAVAGSNGVHLQAAADARTGRATVVAAIDNLGKGAAGQAIQNANLMLGLPETAGLTACGIAP
jgi:N-acetyl-gamma-glutamyl-phosphate reductase